MIVSKTKNIVYCRLPKSASTSVSSALEPYAVSFPQSALARSVRYVTKQRVGGPFFDFRSYSHLSMAGAQKELPQAFFQKATKFTVVRHPLDWVQSYFQHILRENFPPEYQKHFSVPIKKRSFSYFVDWMSDQPRRPLATQLIDDQGVFLIDKVARIENLHDEVSNILAGTQIDFKAPALNRGAYSRDEISSKDRFKIIDLYQSDMLEFGYNEDGSLCTPNLAPTEQTKAVARDLKKSGLERFDCWKPF